MKYTKYFLLCHSCAKEDSTYRLLSSQTYICDTNNVSSHWATLVHKYLLPALPSEQILDQFAYKPNGSTTAAVIAITHHIPHLLESSFYVRCILIDYSKAFDTINLAIFSQKLGQLNIPSNVLLYFLSCRTQAVSSFGQTSSWLPISQSIIQGSGIGPYLYMVYTSDLQT